MDRKIKRSRKQEKDGMTRLGGTVTPRSGAGWSKKGDGRTAAEMVEFKRTDKKQITLKDVDLKKVESEALVEGRSSLLGFQLGGRNYIVLTEDDFLELKWRAGGGAQSHKSTGAT